MFLYKYVFLIESRTVLDLFSATLNMLFSEISCIVTTLGLPLYDTSALTVQLPVAVNVIDQIL